MNLPRFSLLILCCLTFSVPTHAGTPPDKRAVSNAIKEAMEYWKVPGCAVVIVYKGEVIYLDGHGVRELGRDDAVTPDTLFPLGSCTKAFTTTGMAMLVDEGKLAWDDPVRKHLPYFRLSDPLVDEKVTLRDLLTHRTGLGGHELLWYRAAWTPEEAVRRAAHLPLDQPFRTTFQYQSTMYTAAGLALSRTAGMPWDRFVKERLFEPLGMKTACCTTTEAEKVRDRAGGHRRNARGEMESMEKWYPLTTPEPAGSINASVRDLAPWLLLHLHGGMHGKKRLVSTAALGETHKPQFVQRLENVTEAMNPDTTQMSYALAWLVRDHRGALLLEHAGAIDGFRCHIALLPKEEFGLAIVANVHQTRLNLALSNRLIDLFREGKSRDWNKVIGDALRKSEADSAEAMKKRLAARVSDTRPSLALTGYAGNYEHPAYGKATIGVERGQLVCRWSGFTWTLEHFHYDTFEVRDEWIGMVFVVFEIDKEGKVSALELRDRPGVTFRRIR